MRSVLNTEQAPKAIGPYVQAIQNGNIVFTSGQLGIDPKMGKLADGVEAQTHASMNNIINILREAEMTLENVVKTTVFVQDLNDFAKVNEIYASYFEGTYPARSCVEVAKLPMGGLVEIECIAIK